MTDHAAGHGAVSRHRAAVVVGAWHLYGLFFFNQSVFFYAATSDVVPWIDAVQRALLTTWFWIAATPLIIALADHVRRSGMHLATSLLLHALLATSLAFLNAVVDHLRILVWLGTSGEGLGFQLLYQLAENCLLYAVVVLVSYVVHLRELDRARDRAAAELEACLARSELQLLRMQLQPHFLFNTFQSVSTLIHDDPKAADRMVVQLSELLRLSIDHGAEDLVSVDAELEVLESYLGIQRTRYDDRLRVTIEVDDRVRNEQVPHLILQPLVENAIMHGLTGEREVLRVDVEIREVGANLLIVVRDDGAGATEERLERGRGVGLINTSARLRRLYGDAALFEIRTSPGAGFEAIVHLVSRPEPEKAHA